MASSEEADVRAPEPSLDDYRSVVRPGTIDMLRRLSERVRGRSLLNVSASREVGGVAETLRGLVPLLEEVGVRSTWDTLEDTDGAAAALTARLHNALQGSEERLPDDVLEELRTFTRRQAASLDLGADVVVTHDALPAGLALTWPKVRSAYPSKARIRHAQATCSRTDCAASANRPMRRTSGRSRRQVAAVRSDSRYGPPPPGTNSRRAQDAPLRS